MEVELSDEEFKRLARMLLIQYSLPDRGHAVYDIQPIDQKLVDQKLLEIKSKQISEDRVVDYMTLTQWGYHVLTEEQLRLVLCLLELNARHQALTHIALLTQEELPILLTHDDAFVRMRAAKAMRHWLKSEEELWEEFLATR